MLVCVFYLLPIARETAGAARTRHSLLPLIGGSGKLIANLGRMVLRDREVVFADKLFEIRIGKHYCACTRRIGAMGFRSFNLSYAGLTRVSIHFRRGWIARSRP